MEKKSQRQDLRPPIVVVLGHVDHGKTTLLDYLRKTKVVSKEAGGITQGIGASVVTTKDNKDITFIDTPGHAAFSHMRSSGANVSDIALLIVAANDGVKPQTIEALEFINKSKTPFIVVITKSDLPDVNIDKLKSQLNKQGVVFDNEGGVVPIVSVSGKTGEGVNSLLDMICLMWELNPTRSDEDESVVIESVRGKQGISALVVVKSGSLKVAETVYFGTKAFKIRSLISSDGKSKDVVNDGYPALVTGMSEMFDPGSVLTKNPVQNQNSNITNPQRGFKLSESSFPILVKARSLGVIEAIVSNLPEDAVVVSKSVGDLTDSDIFSAKHHNACVIVFESKIPKEVHKLATNEKVLIKEFSVIYEIFDFLKKQISQSQTEILGMAEITAEFPFNKKRVAGVKITSGKIEKNHSLIVLRGDDELGSTKIESLKHDKKDVQTVIQGQEAGLIFSPYLDFKVGDMVVSFNSRAKIRRD